MQRIQRVCSLVAWLYLLGCDLGESTRCQDLCPIWNYQPVCGSNGRDYRNPCLANCDRVSFTRGRCICLCSDVTHKPVCSRDGSTYRNACYARCAGAVDPMPGACAPARNTCGCLGWFLPVCANGVQYRNFCVARCHGAKTYRRGKC